VPVAISIGVTLADTEAQIAIYWFSAAAISSAIGVFLWDEVTGLPWTKRIPISAILVVAICLAVQKGDAWVSAKEFQKASASIALDAQASRIAAAANLEKQKRFTIRIGLGNLLTRNNETRNKCESDKHPIGFSCWSEWIRWRDQARNYISKNMEPPYLARFKATTGTHVEYKTGSGRFLQGEESDAVNLLTFSAGTLDEFIREFQN
jgi:hypothetical protein